MSARLGLPTPPTRSVNNCSNDVELRADLTALQASGGKLTFSCNTSTIAVTSVLPSITKAVTIDGAAVYARFALAVVSIKDSELHDNETTNPTMSLGGAILVWDGASVTVDGSHFHDTRAVQGGAIHNAFANSTVTVRNSLLEW